MFFAFGQPMTRKAAAKLQHFNQTTKFFPIFLIFI